MLKWIVWNGTVLIFKLRTHAKLICLKTEYFEIEQFICIKMDLALNKLQWLMCPQNKQNQTKQKKKKKKKNPRKLSDPTLLYHHYY